MNKIKVLIVDDQESVRDSLKTLLEDYDNLEIIGEAGSVDEARAKIFKYRPNLVFLDIKMPEKEGFELLDEMKDIPEIKIDVVFVTAYYQDYSLKSYEYFPFNFLTKPVSPIKLKEVIERYSQEKFPNDFGERIDKLKKQRQKLSFKQQDGFLLIDPKEILWCKADGNYTIFFLSDGKKERVTESLKSIREKLNEDFYKEPRSFIIAIDKIAKVKWSGKVFITNNPFKGENPEIPIKKTKKIVSIIEKRQ